MYNVIGCAPLSNLETILIALRTRIRDLFGKCNAFRRGLPGYSPPKYSQRDNATAYGHLFPTSHARTRCTSEMGSHAMPVLGVPAAENEQSVRAAYLHILHTRIRRPSIIAVSQSQTLRSIPVNSFPCLCRRVCLNNSYKVHGRVGTRIGNGKGRNGYRAERAYGNVIN